MATGSNQVGSSRSMFRAVLTSFSSNSDAINRSSQQPFMNSAALAQKWPGLRWCSLVQRRWERAAKVKATKGRAKASRFGLEDLGLLSSHHKLHSEQRCLLCGAPLPG